MGTWMQLLAFLAVLSLHFGETTEEVVVRRVGGWFSYACPPDHHAVFRKQLFLGELTLDEASGVFFGEYDEAQAGGLVTVLDLFLNASGSEFMCQIWETQHSTMSINYTQSIIVRAPPSLQSVWLADNFTLSWTPTEPNQGTTYDVEVGICPQDSSDEEECAFSPVESGLNQTSYPLDPSVCDYACSVQRCVVKVIPVDPDLTVVGLSSSLNVSVESKALLIGESFEVDSDTDIMSFTVSPPTCNITVDVFDGSVMETIDPSIQHLNFTHTLVQLSVPQLGDYTHNRTLYPMGLSLTVRLTNRAGSYSFTRTLAEPISYTTIGITETETGNTSTTSSGVGRISGALLCVILSLIAVNLV